MGWSFDDKHALHDELGDAFIVVTPGGNEVVIANPETAHVEGEDWQRHRRLTAPSFNEKVSALVWDEALRQAQDMAFSWYGMGAKGTRAIMEDTATLSLHVLTSAGFGKSYPFCHGSQKPSDGHEMTYRDSLAICLNNIITFAIVPKKFLTLRWLPSRLRTLGQAVKEFQCYMDELLANERKSHRTTPGSKNLVSAMLEASEESQLSAGKDTVSKLSLADNEIFGNIFAYSLAGHETTANTVAAALVLLAAKPEYQQWMAEEIDNVCSTSSNPETWAYDTTFPKLQRCLAVMYETLRLYGSVVFIPKATNPDSVQSLPYRGVSYTIPPSTFVTINVQALQTDQRTWGPDSLAWRPDRWFQTSDADAVSLTPPKPGTFVPWADGPRNCPGQKFAQVEFVAVMAALFVRFRVKPVLQQGQTEGDGRSLLQSMVDGSRISAITLQMQEPKKVALEWYPMGRHSMALGS
ncbi:MAG: hypothetical protein Q9195_001428 [Heterodermia aff. obscurata]